MDSERGCQIQGSSGLSNVCMYLKEVVGVTSESTGWVKTLECSSKRLPKRLHCNEVGERSVERYQHSKLPVTNAIKDLRIFNKQ